MKPVTFWICSQTIQAYALSGLGVIIGTVIGNKYPWGRVLFWIVPLVVFLIPFFITIWGNRHESIVSAFGKAPWSKAKISLSLTSLCILMLLANGVLILNNPISTMILVAFQVIIWVGSIIIMNAFTKEE